MNIVDKQKNNSILCGIKINSIPLEIKVNSDFSLIEIDSLILMDAVHDGLCLNCDFKNQCFWQKNNKVFCEHYQ